jgi:hypothetical protein
MPAYSFKKRFVPYVLMGNKKQTIRQRRLKGFAKPGDTIYLYYGMRTKNCAKIGEGNCSMAVSIAIGIDKKVHLFKKRLTDADAVVVAAKLSAGKLPFTEVDYSNTFLTLDRDGKDLLAWYDGFRHEGEAENTLTGCFDLMLDWFNQTHELPFVGDIIYWNPNF